MQSNLYRSGISFCLGSPGLLSRCDGAVLVRNSVPRCPCQGRLHPELSASFRGDTPRPIDRSEGAQQTRSRGCQGREGKLKSRHTDCAWGGRESDEGCFWLGRRDTVRGRCDPYSCRPPRGQPERVGLIGNARKRA